jgi:nucleotide-binding universal stress UspA family protein
MIVAAPMPRDAMTPAGERDAGAGRTATLRILAAVDGSECTGRVMKCLIGLYVGRGPVEVVLLNVQPKPQDWRLRGYGWFQREAIQDRLINDLGKRVIASAARHLDSVGVTHKDRIELGEPGETILRCAGEEDCDLIVLAEPRSGIIRTCLMRTVQLSIGSFASSVIHLARVPVIVVP